MYEFLGPGKHEFGSPERPFPLEGHSLFVSCIGERGAKQAMRFMHILNYSHGSKELLEAVAAFHAHPQIVRPIQDSMHVRLGWFRKPEVVINDVSLAAKAFHKHSQRHGDSGRAVFHFISYERGTARLTQDVLQSFQSELSGIFHMGILVIPPSDPVSTAQLRREAEEYPLAGLVADYRVLPLVNRHNYRELLKTLSEESKIIGVGSAQGEHKIVTEDRVSRIFCRILIHAKANLSGKKR